MVPSICIFYVCFDIYIYFFVCAVQGSKKYNKKNTGWKWCIYLPIYSFSIFNENSCETESEISNSESWLQCFAPVSLISCMVFVGSCCENEASLFNP